MDPGLRAEKAAPIAAAFVVRGLRYGVVGLATFGIYLLAGRALQQIGIPLVWLAPLSFTVAIAVNYLLQKRWVFADRHQASSSLPRYLVMVGIGYAVNSLALVTLAARLPLFWAQVLVAILVVASNALFAFLWVFPGARRT